MHVRTVGPMAVAAFTALLLTACAPAEAPEADDGPESPVEGSWSIVAIRVTGPAGDTTETVQPSLYIFDDNHYSIMRVTGEGPRALAATDSATDAEKIAAHDSYIANTGTYAIADSSITIQPIVARSPNFMAGGSDRMHFRVSGDTLWLSSTGDDMRSMIAGQLAAPRTSGNTTTFTLVRRP